MEEVERALLSADQKFILMPAKAGSTNFTALTKKCMKKTASSLVLNNIVNIHKYHKPFLQSNMKPPKLITSHVTLISPGTSRILSRPPKLCISNDLSKSYVEKTDIF